MVSIQPPQPGLQEEEPVSLAPLPLESDPSGFTERAPDLLSLLPDEALSLALEVHPAFPMLPPELQAAAYLVRARAVKENRFVEQAYARWTDVLGGLARIALDSDAELAPDELPPSTFEAGRSLRYSIIRIIRGPDEEAPGVNPAPEPQGNRLPRPWSVP